jgi:hypothetical protein
MYPLALGHVHIHVQVIVYSMWALVNAQLATIHVHIATYQRLSADLDCNLLYLLFLPCSPPSHPQLMIAPHLCPQKN